MHVSCLSVLVWCQPEQTHLNVIVLYIWVCLCVSYVSDLCKKTLATPKNQAVWSRIIIINNPMHRRLPIVKKWGVNKHITEWEKTLLGWLHVFSAIVVKWISPVKCLPMEEWDYVDCHTVYLQRIHSGLVGKQPVLGCTLNDEKNQTQTADIRASFCLLCQNSDCFECSATDEVTTGRGSEL